MKKKKFPFFFVAVAMLLNICFSITRIVYCFLVMQYNFLCTARFSKRQHWIYFFCFSVDKLHSMQIVNKAWLIAISGFSIFSSFFSFYFFKNKLISLFFFLEYALIVLGFVLFYFIFSSLCISLVYFTHWLFRYLQFP